MTVNNNELIANFREILTYGYNKTANFLFYENKYRLKKNLLYLMMAATQSYSEAILKLMDNGNNSSVYDKAAEVLYRSLVENFINLNFIYFSKTQKNALVFLAYSIHDRNDFANKFKRLMLKYPQWNLEFGNIKKPQDWDKFIDDNNNLIESGEKKYKITLPKKIPDLRTRAITYDNNLAAKGKLKKNNSLESYYVTYYKFFSQIAHLTMPGLERFYEIDSTGKRTLDIDGKPDSIDRLLSITYQIYFVFLNFFLKEFRLYNKYEFIKFNKFSKSMSK